MPSPRPVCQRCRRPASVCYCRHLVSIDTATRVVLLQHPRERDVPIGTARMANLCLPNSELEVGVSFSGSPVLRRALSDPARPPVLLYPGAGATELPRGPVTLIVVDGTWWQARKVIQNTPELLGLPRYALQPPAPSDYRIRREPSVECVSTIEALAYALGVLEGDPERLLGLLEPFRAMVDLQVEYVKRGRSEPSRYHGAERRVRLPVPACLRDRFGGLVCAVGEANAWPWRSREGDDHHPDEIVQWVAVRVATGERFEMIVAPRVPLAPSTPGHARIPAEVLRAGGTVAELCDRWREFARHTDVICSWGQYGTGLFTRAGGLLPRSRVDLRLVARAVAKRKVGTLEEYAESIGALATEGLGSGRAGARLSVVVAIARHLGGLFA